MKKHFIITLILLISLSLSACTKTDLPAETSNVLSIQEIAIIEKTSTKITQSKLATNEISTNSITVSNEEKEENISTSATTIPQITEVKPNEKNFTSHNKTKLRKAENKH